MHSCCTAGVVIWPSVCIRKVPEEPTSGQLCTLLSLWQILTVKCVHRVLQGTFQLWVGMLGSVYSNKRMLYVEHDRYGFVLLESMKFICIFDVDRCHLYACLLRPSDQARQWP